nr:MAG TPA: hypothetical protein [Caudoviricetes sp.]
MIVFNSSLLNHHTQAEISIFQSHGLRDKVE